MSNLDLLIVGSGISGLSAAISAKLSGARVEVITKSIPTKCNSVMAQGGINAALGNVEEDSVESHIKDTLKASHNLANKEMVELLCSNARGSIEFLEQIGLAFSRIDGAKSAIGSIAQRKLGGASSKRACYAQDYTGLKILHTLLDYTLNLDIEISEGLFLIDLIKNSKGEVCGVLAYNFNSGRVESIYAKRVLLATGGFGSIYSKNTNSLGSSGDGIVAVLKAGGELSNLEFVQFHPTTLKVSNILISESARGEGGYLVDSNGERFIDELAPRDVVAKEIFDKVSANESVYLDLRHIKDIEKLMPQELKLIKTYAKVDAKSELVEIEPAVHYTMGGISVDSNFRAKNLSGVYAVGECSNSNVHGANRLGGNSLLEAVTFGRLAAKSALDIEGSSIEEQDINYKLPLSSSGDNFAIFKAKDKLSSLLFNSVGIIRDEQRLQEAKESIDSLSIESLSATGDSRYNTNLVELLELKNSNILAKALIELALWRRESRGAHIRADYPETDTNFAKSSIITLEDLA